MAELSRVRRRREPSSRVLRNPGGSSLEAARRWSIVALIAIAVLLGGGANPLFRTIVEVVGIAVIALLIVAGADRDRGAAMLAAIFVAIVLVVGVVELAPLPPSIWHGLPGRAVAMQVATLSAGKDAWRPLSLDPQATKECLLALVPALAAFLAGLTSDRADRDAVTITIIAAAAASALFGVFQVAAGHDLYFYDATHYGFPVGFFANRNHEADLLLIALLLLGARIGAGRGDRELRTASPGIAILSLAVLLAVAVLTTASRTGIALLPFVALTAAGLAVGGGGRRRSWLLLAIAVTLGAVLVFLILLSPAIQNVLLRYQFVFKDLRFGFWRDTLFASRAYWPVGSGLGTFVPVFGSIETLDTLSPTYVNHAHNDYLELLLELGVLAPLLIAGYLALFCWSLLRRLPVTLRRDRAAAAAGILVLTAHSLVDYPLRTLALMTIFAFLNGLVLRALTVVVPDPERDVPV